MVHDDVAWYFEKREGEKERKEERHIRE